MLSPVTLIASLNDLLNVEKDRSAVSVRWGHGRFGPDQLTRAQLNCRLLSSKAGEYTRKREGVPGVYRVALPRPLEYTNESQRHPRGQIGSLIKITS